MKAPFEKILILDDDYLHNALAVFSIRKLLRAINLETATFTNPFELLYFIEEEYTYKPVKTILLLDIYMAHLSGWDVMESIESMPKCIQQYFTVYMLTNSHSEIDIEKARSIALVKNYFIKPLANHLPEIFDEVIASMIPGSFGGMRLSQALHC